MSTALPFAGAGNPAPSPAESAAFGFSVARLAIGGRWEGDVADVDALVNRVAAQLDGEKADTVILRFPSELVQLARLAPTSGRRFQHAGTLLYWEDPLLGESADAADAGAETSEAGAEPGPEFVEAALAVIADSFDGYLNHYSYNDRIPDAVSRDGYVDWARRTIADPAGIGVIVSDDGSPVAAATIRLHDSSDDAGDAAIAEVELAGVASAQQGTGRYQRLWHAIRDAVRASGATRLIISTQASNLRVQRAWARLGLLPLAAFDTVHSARERNPHD